MTHQSSGLKRAAVQFVRAFFENGKPVGAICHGPWLLVEADVARGRTLTSYASIKTDLKNAGADWVDREVVVDQGLVTSRNPGDLDAFSSKLIEEFAEVVVRRSDAAPDVILAPALLDQHVGARERVDLGVGVAVLAQHLAAVGAKSRRRPSDRAGGAR